MRVNVQWMCLKLTCTQRHTYSLTYVNAFLYVYVGRCKETITNNIFFLFFIFISRTTTTSFNLCWIKRWNKKYVYKNRDRNSTNNSYKHWFPFHWNATHRIKSKSKLNCILQFFLFHFVSIYHFDKLQWNPMKNCKCNWPYNEKMPATNVIKSALIAPFHLNCSTIYYIDMLKLT